MQTRLTPRSVFLVLGRAGMDLYADPPGTAAETATRFAAALGGSSGNIAAGLARQGRPVGLLSCVSDDSVGRFVRRELAAYGVDTRHVHDVEAGARTSLAVTETRIEDTQNTLYRNNAADLLLDESHVAGVDFRTVDALVVTGTALASAPSRAATLMAMGRAREAGGLVVLDLDYRPYSWPGPRDAAETYRAAIELTDLVVGNDDEFAVVAEGDRPRGRIFADEIARGDRTVIYKMGENGSVVVDGRETFETGIFPVSALKPMGAGDAFLAGLLAALAGECSLRDAVLYGSAAAAIVVSRFGCAPAMPTPAELDAFLRSHSAPQT